MRLTEKTPLTQKCYELCLAIEGLPASERATNLSVQASALGEAINAKELQDSEPQDVDMCGAVGGTRDGRVTSVCQLPKGHAGKHGGMGCEWNDAACVKVLVSLLCLLITSCQLATHEAHASATKWEKDMNITWGGTTHTTGADGWDNATDHNASFQVAAQTAGALGGEVVAGSVSKAKTASDNSVTAAKNASDAATAQKLIDAQAAKDAAAAKLAQQAQFLNAGIKKP